MTEGVANPLLLGDVFDVATDAVRDGQRPRRRRLRAARAASSATFNDDTLQTLTLDVTDDSVGGSSILRLQDTEANERRIGIFRGQSGAGANQAPDDQRGRAQRHAAPTARPARPPRASTGWASTPRPGTGDAENCDFGNSVVRYIGRQRGRGPRSWPPRSRAASTSSRSTASSGADVEVITGSDFDGIESDLQPPPQPLGAGGGGGAGGGTAPVGQVPSVDPPERAAC